MLFSRQVNLEGVYLGEAIKLIVSYTSLVITIQQVETPTASDIEAQRSISCRLFGDLTVIKYTVATNSNNHGNDSEVYLFLFIQIAIRL